MLKEYRFVGYIHQKVMVSVVAENDEEASDRAYSIHPDDWDKVGTGCVEEVEILDCYELEVDDES